MRQTGLWTRRLTQCLVGLAVVAVLVGSGVAQPDSDKQKHHNQKDVEKPVTHASLDATIKSRSTGSEATAITPPDMIKEDLADVATHLEGKIEEPKVLVKALDVLGTSPCGVETEGQRFVLSKENTEVCDNTTGLYWEQSPSASGFDWQSAKDHCANLNPNNAQAYRLAKVKELITLVDYSLDRPAMSVGHPFSHNVWSSRYWSAPNAAKPTGAWHEVFGNGIVFGSFEDGTFHAWCVR